ncbi:MAG: T9SS type A sorting domain-containing protein, partial [Algibacter sp.]
DPSATITGLSGGSFSSTSGLSINTSTGAIDVSASTPGLYIVTYTTAGTCPNSSNVNVTVNALDDASFNYSTSAYCADATDPSATITGLSGGSFSSTSGLSINTSTGAIDVSASTPGLYTVTYTTAGTCPNSSNVNVTVNALDDASFSYSAATYDTGDPDATPTITGLAGGAFSSSPVGLSINSVTGVIDTSASTVDTYLVTYTTAGSCPNTSNVNITITSSLSNEAVENRLELSILNPVKEVLTIIGTERITSVSVYSLTGALVATSKDISHLETGLYIAVLETSKGTISKKIIKK